MIQQINLYQDVLRERPQPLHGRTALMILAAALLGTILLTIVQGRQKADLEQQLADLQKTHKAAQDRVAALDAKFPEPRQDALLMAKMQRLEQQVAGQRAALDYFDRQSAAGNQAMFDSLRGLARHSPKGVWLRKVQLRAQGRRVELAGTARGPEDVPEYVQMLGEKNVFGGRVFAQLELVRREQQHPERIDFFLKSAEETQ